MITSKTTVIACSVLQRELEAVISHRDIDLKLLDQDLHRTPQLMPLRIKEAISQAESEGAKRLILGYGLCSNGLAGITANRPLVMPRCHDCIAMIVGSPAKYRQLFRRNPGTYYLTAGWLDVGKDPLTIVEREYSASVGLEDAMWVMNTELTHYTHFCYLKNGLGNDTFNKRRVLENCRALGKEYMELECTLDYFQALIDGPHPPDDFLSLSPEEKITEAMFRAL